MMFRIPLHASEFNDNIKKNVIYVDVGEKMIVCRILVGNQKERDH
jgi:hypothetical protein